MKLTFTDRLIEAVKAKKSHISVGLDPRIQSIPKLIRQDALSKHGSTFKAVSEAFLQFNKQIIDAVSNHVPAIKLQIAFYEQYGSEGIDCFNRTVKYAKQKGLIVIADVKRNDIGSTVQAYSSAYLGRVKVFDKEKHGFDVDCITVNPYLGYDSIKPFIDDIKRYQKGIFVLVRTSNPSAKDIQDLEIGSKKLWEVSGGLVNEWGKGTAGKYGYSAVGAVVGATYPFEIDSLRRIIPKAYFLIPGFGAQGGKAEDIVSAFNEDGYGGLINSSRDIIFAYLKSKQYSEDEFAEAAESAIIKMNQEINTKISRG